MRRARWRRVGGALFVLLAIGAVPACAGDDDDGTDEALDASVSTPVSTTGGDDSDRSVDVSSESPIDGTPQTTTTSTTTTTTTLTPGGSSSDDVEFEESDDPSVPRPPLLDADGQNEQYSGVAQVDGFGSQCTGFLLDVGRPDDPAHLMTNAHCVGLFDAMTVLTSSVAPDEAVVRFRLFEDTPDDVLEVPVLSVVYGSMRATDVAIVELDATRAELDDEGIVAYALGRSPDADDAVTVVGIPVTGVAPDEHVLRHGRCTTGETVGLVEWEWRWDRAIDTDCKGIFGGNSGSPMFAVGDPTRVVGIVNTTTIGAGEGGACFLGQPCEIAEGAVVERRNRTYAMPVAAWASCWGDDGFDPDADGCPAEREPLATVDAPLRAVQTGASWGATIRVVDDSRAAADVSVATKTGPIATTDCRRPDGYSELDGGGLTVADNEQLPPDEGFYVLCAAVVVDGEPIVSTAGYAVMEIDDTPPVGETELSVRRTDTGASVEPIFAVPERSDFLVKFGDADETDCADEDDYLPYRRIPIQMPADVLPATVCVIAADEAGNQAPPESFVVE